MLKTSALTPTRNEIASIFDLLATIALEAISKIFPFRAAYYWI